MGCLLSTYFTNQSTSKAKGDHSKHGYVKRSIKDQTFRRELEVYGCEQLPKDLHSIICRKNPGHTDFIPIEELTLEYLPEQMRNRDYLNFLFLQADLTVKINASIVSEDRPEVRLRTGDAYPHGDGKFKKNMIRVGTGTVVKVTPKGEGRGQCVEGNELKIITSRHNVWNEAELKGVTIDISFHDAQGKNTFPTTLKADSNSKYSVINMDACSLSFITDDDTLGFTLANFCDRFWQAARDLKNLHQGDSASAPDSDDTLSIVSYPHGCQKCVSFGIVKTSILYLTESWTSVLYVLARHLSFSLISRSDEDMCVAYTTPTCKGCSGALVLHFCKSQGYLKICTHEGHRNEDDLNHSGNPEFIREECLGVTEEGSSGLRERRKYSNQIDGEEAKRYKNDANDLSFRQQLDYHFQRCHVMKLRELAQKRYGPQIEDEVSKLICEGKKYVDAAIEKDEKKLRTFEVPYINTVLAETPSKLKKQKGYLINQFLSHKLGPLLKNLDLFADQE